MVGESKRERASGGYLNTAVVKPRRVSWKTLWSDDDLFVLLTRLKLLNQLKPSHSRQLYRRYIAARRRCWEEGGRGGGEDKKRKRKIKGFKNCRENKCGTAAEKKETSLLFPRREMDTRGQTRSQNIKAKRKLPDKQTGVHLNECSFRPVVCRNHCYPLTAGCPFVSFHLLPVSSLLIIPLPFLSRQPLSFPFASSSPHLGVLSSSPLFERFKMTLLLLIHCRHPWVNCVSDLTATRTLTRKHTHMHAHVIQMHVNIAHREPEGTNKMNDKWHKWLEEEGLPWISKTLCRGQSDPSSLNRSVISPADVDIQFPNPCVTHVWL